VLARWRPHGGCHLEEFGRACVDQGSVTGFHTGHQLFFGGDQTGVDLWLEAAGRDFHGLVVLWQTSCGPALDAAVEHRQLFQTQNLERPVNPSRSPKVGGIRTAGHNHRVRAGGQAQALYQGGQLGQGRQLARVVGRAAPSAIRRIEGAGDVVGGV